MISEKKVTYFKGTKVVTWTAKNKQGEDVEYIVLEQDPLKLTEWEDPKARDKNWR